MLLTESTDSTDALGKDVAPGDAGSIPCAIGERRQSKVVALCQVNPKLSQGNRRFEDTCGVSVTS
jgi:hypothetical protein